MAGAVAVPLGVLAFAGWLSFDRVRQQAERDASHTAYALSEHAHRTLRAHELIIQFVDRYTEGRDKAVRAELRFPDPSSNPYLAFTVMLAAALDGIENNMEASKPLNNINLYHLDKEERTKLGVRELPGSLAEALTELDKDEVIKSALGANTYEAFSRAKWEEWDEFRMRVSDYEIERYLETA